MTRPLLDFSGRTVDLETGQIHGGGVLRPMEAALLRYLAGRMGQTVPYADLLESVWGYRTRVRTNTLHTTLCRLRIALEPDPASPIHLHTVTGRGLRLTSGVASLDGELVGRSDLLAHLATRPPEVITLVGPAGVGKTRLAVEYARRSGLPTCFRDLSAADKAADIEVGETPALLVLDGADRIDDLGPWVLAWKQVVPTSQILVTRRRSVGFEGERRLPVGPLDRTESAELLSHRIRAIDPTFDPGGSEDRLESLLALADGLPLAIERMAPHVAALGVTATVEVLQTDRSLGEVFDQTWRELPELERTVLSQLAVFARPFTLAAATPVIVLPRGAPTLAAVIVALVEQGLLRRDGPQFALLSPLRTRIGAADPSAVDRQFAAVRGLATRLATAADGLLVDVPFEAEDADEVLRTARIAVHRAGEPELGPLFEVAVRMGEQAGKREAASELANAVLAADPDPGSRVRLAGWCADQMWEEGRTVEARAAWCRLPAEAGRAGMPALAAAIELTAAHLFNNDERQASADAIVRAERWACELPPTSVRLAAYLRGRAAHVRGCLLHGEASVAEWERAVHELSEAGRPDALARARGHLSHAHCQEGRYDEALRHAELGLAGCPSYLPGPRSELLVLAAQAHAGPSGSRRRSRPRTRPVGSWSGRSRPGSHGAWPNEAGICSSSGGSTMPGATRFGPACSRTGPVSSGRRSWRRGWRPGRR